MVAKIELLKQQHQTILMSTFIIPITLLLTLLTLSLIVPITARNHIFLELNYLSHRGPLLDPPPGLTLRLLTDSPPIDPTPP